jgi:hypothetical protein
MTGKFVARAGLQSRDAACSLVCSGDSAANVRGNDLAKWYTDPAAAQPHLPGKPRSLKSPRAASPIADLYESDLP